MSTRKHHTTVTVVIGRNVGSTPMSLDRWVAFWQETHDALNACLHYATVTELNGAGEWEGIREDTHAVYAYYSGEGPGWSEAQADRLRSALGTLATLYSQDAIACAFSADALVFASEVTA